MRTARAANVLSLLVMSIAVLLTRAPCLGDDDFDLPAQIQLTKISDNATHYATTHSYNQKVVVNRNGVFMVYVQTRYFERPFNRGLWRLLRSTDGGRTFEEAYSANNSYTTPVLETDEFDNLYVMFPNFADNSAFFYKFPADNYGQPKCVSAPDGCYKGVGGKYYFLYDRGRKQFYYFPKEEKFFVLDMDGAVRSSRVVMRGGERAHLEYPSLRLSEDGTLHAAWTTDANDQYLYRSIHYMRSQDGGLTWRKMNGAVLQEPITADETGPADMINLEDELDVHTWLQSMLVRDGKVHFVYRACAKSGSAIDMNRMHYVRYDLASAKKEIDIAPEIKGDQLSLNALQGVIFTNPWASGDPIYYVSFMNKNLACLASHDGGETWRDYARHPVSLHAPRTPGGCRELTSDGRIIGSFTDSKGPTNPATVYFFSIKTGSREVND